MGFKFLEHTADVKVRVVSNSLENAFIEAGKAIKQVIAEDVKVKEEKVKKIEIEADDMQGLLYNFLEEFLFFLDAEDFLVSKVKSLKIDKKNFKLKASLIGDDASKYKFSNDVKAVTYNDMKIEEVGASGKGGSRKEVWELIFVLDV